MTKGNELQVAQVKNFTHKRIKKAKWDPEETD